MATSLARPGLVLNDMTALDRAAFERTEIFNDALVKDDSYYTIFGNFPVGHGVMLAQALIRGRREGPFGDEEVARMTALVPHLSRVTRMRYLLREVRGERDDLRRALDALPTAVALLDASGKVVCANEAADRLLRRRDVVWTQHGKLTAARSSDDAALVAALARAAIVADAGRRAPPPASVAPASVLLARDGRRPLVLFFLPLRPQSVIRERDVRAVRVLLVMHDPERDARVDPALVARIHGLTTTEALLAVALAEGRTLRDFARSRGSSEQTARTHLKRVLEKTETTRQAELVRLLLLGPAAHSLG